MWAKLLFFFIIKYLFYKKMLPNCIFFDTDDLQLRRQMLIAQLALGYEFVKNTGIEYC